MENNGKIRQQCEEIEYGELVEFSDNDEIASSIMRDAFSGGLITQSSIQNRSLQSVIDNYANAMNQSAIAKSTGLPVRTPVQQYKGFVAEEYFKHTLKINTLAKGIPNSKIGVYTGGQMPDGSVLSGIDMETDISIWARKNPWGKPMRMADYQSKIHNNSSAYSKDLKNPQYENKLFVGGAGQGVNDKIKVDIGRKTITSDSITPEEAAELAKQMKDQSAPDYAKRQEKYDELNKITFKRAVAAGAATGFILSTVQEIVGVIKNAEDLSEKQFKQSIEHIIAGTVDGGVRSGAIAGSVQLFGKMLGKEITTNSLEAIPAMAAANVAVDFAKDLYNCFVTQSIDIDDLLCNSINNAFTSVASFTGSWIGGQTVGLLTSAKVSAETGAAIGSSAGPIGTVIGAAVGGIVIGIGANIIIGAANKDAENAYSKCITDINNQIELSFQEKLYYFVDSMENISEFRLSFKNLLPCYNLISDLKEYNLHKKAIHAIDEELAKKISDLDGKKKEELKKIEIQHSIRISELRKDFEEQRMILQDDFRESVNTYLANSYMQYISINDILNGNINMLLQELEGRKTEHSYILNYLRNRNAVNEQINITLSELMDSEDYELLRPFIDRTMWIIQQDELLVGRQYISFEEALYLVNGGELQ